jgi:hypothetical protein
MVFTRLRIACGMALFCLLPIALPAAESFRVATYNVENCLDIASFWRPRRSSVFKIFRRMRVVLPLSQQDPF